MSPRCATTSRGASRAGAVSPTGRATAGSFDWQADPVLYTAEDKAEDARAAVAFAQIMQRKSA